MKSVKEVLCIDMINKLMDFYNNFLKDRIAIISNIFI